MLASEWTVIMKAFRQPSVPRGELVRRRLRDYAIVVLQFGLTRRDSAGVDCRGVLIVKCAE